MKLISLNKIFILLSFLFITCKDDKIVHECDWSIGITEPIGYPIGEGDIVFYNHHSASFNFPTIMCSKGWANILTVREIYNAQIPDSLFVSYVGLNEKNNACLFEGGIKLSEEKIINCLNKSNGLYSNAIYCGLAPGGRIGVFVGNYEILRFNAKKIKEYKTNSILLNENELNRKKIDVFLNKNPINYKNWEFNDPCYSIDFSFCSEDDKSDYIFMDFFSKEGIYNSVSSYNIDYSIWNKSFNNKADLTGNFYLNYNDNFSLNKMQLPVNIIFCWERKSLNSILYCSDIILPKDFPIRFTKSYINPKTGKKCNYNRLVFGVEKDGEHCIIWLDGPDKQEKLMRFKGQKAFRNQDNGIESGGYATEVTYY